MTVAPLRDRKKHDEEIKKAEEEEQRRQRAADARKAKERREAARYKQASQYTHPQYPSYPNDEKAEQTRRNFLGWTIGGIAALVSVGMIGYFLSLSGQPSPPPTQQPNEQNQQTNQTEQPNPPSTQQPTKDMSNPDEWPTRNSLLDLENALHQSNSYSQYNVKEYEYIPQELVGRPPNLWGLDVFHLSENQVLSMYPDLNADYNSVMKGEVLGGDPRMIIYTVKGDPCVAMFFDMRTYSGTETEGYEQCTVALDQFLRALNPVSPYNVLFRNNSKRLYSVYQG
jgi:hypothetical protein